MRRLRSNPWLVWWALGLLVVSSGVLWAAERKKFQKTATDMTNKPLPPPDASRRVLLIGNKSFTEAELLVPLADSLKEIETGGLTRPRADDAAYYLSIHYRKQGFPQAEVKWEIRGPRLVLTIKEGPRTYLKKITFQGNKTQTSADLYEYMIGETGERLLVQPGGYPFVEADMQTGVARLRGLYETEGRLDAKVADPEITISKDGTGANVRVTIVEGPKYEFGAVSFTGAPMFERDRLIEALSNPSGEEPANPDVPVVRPLEEPYTGQRANALRHNLEYFFKLQGYYAAAVTVAAESKNARFSSNGVRRVPITFQVKPGAFYRFDGVKVEGLTRLRPDFMQKRFGKLTGQPYNPVKLDEKYREVLRTGLFKNLRISTVALRTNEVRVDLKAEEAKAKEIGFSIGFSSYEGAIAGLRFADRNFMGRGRPLALDIDYSTRSLAAELLYVDPWWFDSDYSLRARLFAQTRTEEGYAKREFGLRADVLRKFTKHYDASLFLQAKDVGLIEEETFIEPQFLGATSYQVITLGLTQTLDYRDNPINPSRGFIMSLGLDADAIANQVAFGRATARISYYIPIRKKFLLALGARAGVIYPVEEVPIDERFFNGGGTTVRSFRERRLGPKDKHGYPIGGEAFTTFNAEFIIPIKDALAAAIFVDAGNVASQFEDAGFDDMRFAIGLGLRYKLPIGPVRLDVGMNPAPKKGESWGAVHFSFGFAF